MQICNATDTPQYNTYYHVMNGDQHMHKTAFNLDAMITQCSHVGNMLVWRPTSAIDFANQAEAITIPAIC